jgi:general secretion pathway protein A
VSFTPSAIAAVHAASGGVPRLINLICDRALLAGYARGTRSLDAAMVRQAAREVSGARPRQLTRQGAVALGGGLVAASALAAVMLFPSAASAPLPTLAASSAPPKAPPPAQPSRLDELVASAPKDASAAQAFLRLEEQWSAGPLERTALRANGDQLRRLDLPAALEMFHPRRAETCFLTLLSLDGEQAFVSIMGEALRVPWREVDALWTRNAVVAWRDFDGIGRGTAPAEPWLRDQLGRLGHLREGTSLSDGVASFQRDAGLVVDGVFGSRTLMALYARGDGKRPRLRGGAS